MELSDETMGELLALAGVALSHEHVQDALEQVCHIATRAIVPADGATLMTLVATGPDAIAASSPWAKQLDELQYIEHEGPCIDAARTGALFRVRDIASDPRWPSYMPRARAHGARSMLSIPLAVESKTLGALDLYSRDADAFDAEAVALAEIIAGHATLAAQVATALHGHRALAEHLHHAMASRAAIEQAKGIVMATTRCTPDEAFLRLSEQSQHEGRKLRDIADELVRRQAR